MIIRVNERGNHMLLKKAAKWLIDSELECIGKGEKADIHVFAMWCSNVSGYILSVKFNDSPNIVISSQREEKRVFKKTDSMIKSLNDVGLHKVTISR